MTIAQKNRPDATDTFYTMPVRLFGEREERSELAGKALNYHHPFLDDVLRGILPHDLILLGAPTGLGKTDLALSIAVANALKGVHVAYFALEAEPRELERRTKFAWISNEAWQRGIARRSDLQYIDWHLGRCEHIVGDLDREADEYIENNLGSLWTFYRGQHFGQDDLRKQIEAVHKLVNLVVIDHLHYVDFDDENETRALGDTVKLVRDVALRVGRPVLLVAHLRKRDQRLKQVVPSLDDFHGSSNIVKICTQVITIEKATSIEAPKWWLAPTFMSILKDRRAGAPPFVALTMFDRRTRRYEDTYSLGRVVKGGTAWEQIAPADQPSWARSHRQLELEMEG